MLTFDTAEEFGHIPPLKSGLVGYPSGQRGQTVNLLAYAFDSSNLSPTTIFKHKGKAPFPTSATVPVLGLVTNRRGGWDLRLYQRFDAVAIEAFAGGKGFGGKTAVNVRFYAQHKLPAE